jgi:hypothetical protein
MGTEQAEGRAASIARAALGHVRALAEQIGPRPAGSPAERQAFDYLAGRLEAGGWRVERTPASFAPVPRFFPWYGLGGVILAVAGWAAPRYPLVAALAPVGLVFLPQAARWILRRRARTGQSENLLALPGEGASPPLGEGASPSPGRLLLCAHVDSARASAFRHRALLWLRSKTLFLGLRLAFLFAVMAGLAALGVGLPPLLKDLLLWAGALFGALWVLVEVYDQAAAPRYSPGAYDNASGVGLLLALAEHLGASGGNADTDAKRASRKGEDSRLSTVLARNIGFLFTGAEETGLHGALAFADRIAEDPQWRGARVLNVDMMGAGDRLVYVSRDGLIWPRRTDARLNALVARSAPGIGELSQTLRSGDHLPFLERGIAATTLQAAGSARAELAYHTEQDTPALLEEDALARAAAVLLAAIENTTSGE